ncbi:uncharacterized protein LOC128386082 isoform X2 [Panonychus citri]|uniref:uncharacterized protein LOC128386082 isoform X2 n=1 Tax=Panonychus citri TaxID=50023 RepID=UPI00230810D8|nr:uncharacterized protein LOC128386082 isoform X2 [Panonychus citri]
MWKLFQQKSSKMKVSLQENCSYNQDKSSTLNRPTVSQEFDNLSSYTLPRGNQYKSSSLPPPPPTRTTKVTNQSSISNTIKNSRPVSITSNSLTMSAEDDSCAINELLEGRMNLTVLLPPELIRGKSLPQGDRIVINVERRTPMMDILVNIATQCKFNASKYRVKVDSFSFQASTPIGSLDVNTIAIVPKPVKASFRSTAGTSEMNLPQSMPSSSSSVIYSIPNKQRSATLSTPLMNVKVNENQSTNLNSNHQGLPFISNVPFKTTFRLQVNLPRNQLMVLRVSPESTIAQIKSKICDEKELDSSKFHLIAKNEKEMLILDSIKCLADYGVNEVTLMSTNLLTKTHMEQSTSRHLVNGNDENQLQDLNNLKEQSANQVAIKMNKGGKKRAAPLPPKILNVDDVKIGSNEEPIECEENNSMDNVHYRQDSGSDSSGYHESMISSESHKSLSEGSNRLAGQNKLNRKENMRKGIVKKRKAPLPPDWRDKSEISESVDCSSDVSVALSASSGSSRQSNYRVLGGRASSRDIQPEDEPSFTLVSECNDLDAAILKASDSAPIPSPDSGTCSHVPMDEEKSNDGITQFPGSGIMSDSAIGDTIIEEAENELEQESFSYETNKRLLMKPLSYSSTSSLRFDRDSCKTINKQIDTIQEMDSPTLANGKYLSYSEKSLNSNYEQFDETDYPKSISNENQLSPSIILDNEPLKEEVEPDTNVTPTISSESGLKVNDHESEILTQESTCRPNNHLNINDDNCEKSVKNSDEISPDEFEESNERETSLSSSIGTISIEDQEDGTSNNHKDFSSDANQIEEESSIESTRTPTIVSEMKTIMNGETDCHKNGNEKRDDCLFGQDVKTRTPRIDQNNDPEDNGDSVSSELVRDLCRPRVRLTNFKIGSYKEIENLDIYQSNNSNDFKERFDSSNCDAVKPVIVTASFKNVNLSACNEFGHNNVNTKSTNSSQNKISVMAPQPFKLNRLASWSGTDTKSFRQAYSNVSNCIEDRETIAEKAEKIEKVLRISRHKDQLSCLNNVDNVSHEPSRGSAHESQTVNISNSSHRCVSQIELNGDSSKVSIRNTVTTIKGINNLGESPIQVTTFVKSKQLDKSDKQTEPNQLGKQKQSDETNTKLEIINTVKPSPKTLAIKVDPISPMFNIIPTKTTEPKGSKPKVPLPVLPLIVSQPPPPPPPPPPPMPKATKIASKLNTNASTQRSKSSNDQTNGKERPNSKSVPKFRKTILNVGGSSASKGDFHDALLNEIRACGGRRALRKVNINR